LQIRQSALYSDKRTPNMAAEKAPKNTFTVVLVHSVEEIEYHTLPSLEEVNIFIRTAESDNKEALVFVVNGELIPESQWRLPDENDTEKYWIII